MSQRDCDKVYVEFYTTAFRKVRVVELSGNEARQACARGVIECRPRVTGGLASGTYYIILKAERTGNIYSSRIEKLIIIR